MILMEIFALLGLFLPLAALEQDEGWEKKYSIEKSWKEEKLPDILGFNGQQGESKELGFYSQEELSEEHRVKRDFEGSATATPTEPTAMSTTRRPCIVYRISPVIKTLKFVAALLNVFSVPYAKLAAAVLDVIRIVLEAIKEYKQARVIKMRSGSIIVDMEITFYVTEDTPKESEVQQMIDNAIQSATFTIETSTTALTATHTTIGATEKSIANTSSGESHTAIARTVSTTERSIFANVETIKPLTETTNGSEPTKGYKDTVTFTIVITIDEPYDSILSDPESAGFRRMRNRFVSFLEPICKNISGCREIVVNSFSEGSIVADIDLIFLKDETTSNALMIEEHIIKAKDDGLAPFVIQSLRVSEKNTQKVDEKVETWKVALIAGFGVMTLIMIFSSVLIFAMIMRQRRKRNKRSRYNFDCRRNNFELDYSFFSYDVGKTD